MKKTGAFAAFLDNIVDNPGFQKACQRNAEGAGSTEAIAMAVLNAVGFIDTFEQANRYRYLRETGVASENGLLKGRDLDLAIDASLMVEPVE